ncbi:hypothetical protein HPB48_012897 [Haemaphysalis longicornis]|uniref:Uncharacterized protein n=1 Tax=Haemaphysalis longicornis TaxID=44386 RepID=A0A9J6G7F3_HAELO|nr:hypothetical protein HPB48_012897 [Haemaphysalis longicornis]
MHDFYTKNPQQLWTLITLKKIHISTINMDGTEVAGSARIATAFNDFISSVFLRSSNTTVSFQTKGLDVPDRTISEEATFSAPLKLDTKKSAELDEILNAIFFWYAQ